MLNGGGLDQQSAAAHTLWDVVDTQLCLAREVKDLRVTTPENMGGDLPGCHTPVVDMSHEV